MTENQKKYEAWSKPVLWTNKSARAQKSIFQYRLDDETGRYFTTRLGIYNGFLGLFGKVMYYIPETDNFQIVKKWW